MSLCQWSTFFLQADLCCPAKLHGVSAAKPQHFGSLMEVLVSTFRTVMKLETGKIKLKWKKKETGRVSVYKEWTEDKVRDKESCSVSVRSKSQSLLICL